LTLKKSTDLITAPIFTTGQWKEVQKVRKAVQAHQFAPGDPDSGCFQPDTTVHLPRRPVGQSLGGGKRRRRGRGRRWQPLCVDRVAAQALEGPVGDDIVDEATRGGAEEGGALLLAPLAFELVQRAHRRVLVPVGHARHTTLAAVFLAAADAAAAHGAERERSHSTRKRVTHTHNPFRYIHSAQSAHCSLPVFCVGLDSSSPLSPRLTSSPLR